MRTVLHSPVCEFLRPDGIACTCGAFKREIARAKLPDTPTTTTPEETAVPDADEDFGPIARPNRTLADKIADAPLFTHTEGAGLACTCPGDPSASAAGWNPSCPVHAETEVVRAFGMTADELADQAQAGYPVCSICRGVGGHASNCTVPVAFPSGEACHRCGNAIMTNELNVAGPDGKRQHVTCPGPALTQPGAWCRHDVSAHYRLTRAETTGDRARDICNRAADLVNNDRLEVYGDAEVNFRETGALWAVVFGHDVTPEQVALCMSLVKVARLIKSPDHADSWTDGVGYLALGGGIAARPTAQ